MAVGFAQAVEPVARHDGANDASLDGRRDFQRVDQPVEQTHIAEFHNRRRCRPDMIEAFQSKGENFRVGRRCIGSTDRFEARLHELAAFAGPHPENRTAIAVARGLRSMRVQVLEADRDRVFGAQAKFGAGRILRHEHAAANVLARQIDEHIGRLQHCRLDPRIAFALEKRDQRHYGIRLRHWRRSNP